MASTTLRLWPVPMLGIAIGAGTDVAMESADIVLMRSDLLDVAGAIELSKATIRNIKENLFWAFFYNIIGMPHRRRMLVHSVQFEDESDGGGVGYELQLGVCSVQRLASAILQAQAWFCGLRQCS